MIDTQPALILHPLSAQPPVSITLHKNDCLQAQCIAHMPPPRDGDNSITLREVAKNGSDQKILVIGCNSPHRGIPNEYVHGMYGSVLVTGGYAKPDNTSCKLVNVAQSELTQFVSYTMHNLH
jgi:hypothetical protein